MYLTKNEIEIMDVLWKEGRPLARGEILSLSEDKSWMDSSVHILLNSMLKKGAIREAGFVKCGKTCGRVYEAALSCEEYYVSTLESTRAPIWSSSFRPIPIGSASRRRTLRRSAPFWTRKTEFILPGSGAEFPRPFLFACNAFAGMVY